MQFSESPKSGKEIFLNPVKLWQGNKIEPIKCRLIDDRVEKNSGFFILPKDLSIIIRKQN